MKLKQILRSYVYHDIMMERMEQTNRVSDEHVQTRDS